MTFDGIVHQVNTHRLSVRFSIHTVKKAAVMMSFHAEKCCHLLSAHAAVSAVCPV